MAYITKKIIHRFIRDITEYEQGGDYYAQIIPDDTQVYANYTSSTKSGLYFVIGDGIHTYTEIRDGQGKTSVNREYKATGDTKWGEIGGTLSNQTDLQSALTAEATTRASADTTLQTNINTEVTTRANADTILQNNINAEGATRAATDTSLQEQINQKQPLLTSSNAGDGIEITGSGSNVKITNTRTSAEWGNITGTLSNQTDLQTVLTTEATTRANTDTNLQYQINTKQNALTAGTGISLDNNSVAIQQNLSITYNINPSGGLVNNKGVLSNFTLGRASLTKTLTPMEGYSNDWLIHIKFKTGESLPNITRYLFGTNYNVKSILIGQNTTGILSYWLSSNNTTWDICNGASGSLTLNTNTDYILSISRYKPVNIYSFSISSDDGETWNDDFYIESSSEILPNQLLYLGDPLDNSSNCWLGTIDLNKCLIKVDSESYWEGVTTIGSVAKATTSLYGLVKPDGNTITIDDGVISAVPAITIDNTTITKNTLDQLQASSLVGLTATTTELNVLDGITATTTELNYTDGVTSNIQTQLNSKLNTSDVVNNVTTTTTNQALSANMGKELQDQITNLKQRGRYLSIWNSATGLATTTPTVNPYTYKAGDYFIVGVIASGSANNYKPVGSTYDKDVPSRTIETEDVIVNDTYYYDGTSWSLLHTSQPTVAFSTLAGSPYDNTNLTTALNEKANSTDIKDGVLTIQKNGADIATFSANQSTAQTANIIVPTAAADITYTNPDYPTVGAALDKLLYVTPSVSISGGGNYEIGTTISSVNLTWTWNKAISSQSLNQGIGALATDVRSYTYSTPITSNKTFTITGSDGTTTKSAYTNVSFFYKRYWGVSANTTLTDAEILALSQELSSSRAQTRTFNCSGGKYFYFVIPTTYCSGISFKVGGLSFSDYNVVTRNVVNAQGYTASYNIYRPNNIQTGSSINVVVS